MNNFEFMDSETPNPFGANLPAFQFNEIFVDPTNFQQLSCLSNNSTSDEAEKQHIHAIDERKQRRMISNRESARRSRVRKQRQLDELWSLMMCLRNENNNLMEKLNQLSKCHDRVLEENANLKGEAFDLRQELSSMQLVGDYLRVESLNESISSCDEKLN